MKDTNLLYCTKKNIKHSKFLQQIIVFTFRLIDGMLRSNDGTTCWSTIVSPLILQRSRRWEQLSIYCPVCRL